MSHFTVLVIGDDIEEQLAPYDENISVEPYRSYWDTDYLQRMTEMLEQKDGGLPKGEKHTIEEVAAAYNRCYGDDEEAVQLDEGGIYTMSTYNPKSKWDWYVIGGRWRGFFKAKDGAKTAVGVPGTLGGDPVGADDADVLRREDVDLEAMRQPAREAAEQTWDKAHAVIKDIEEEALGWEQLYAEAKAAKAEVGGELVEGDIAALRDAYRAQPRVKALMAAELIGPFGNDAADYQVSREEYVRRAELSAITPYAYVKDGVWNAPGDMGWWGMSTDTGNERLRFAEEFNAMFEALPGDMLLTLVDCHI